MLETCSIFVPSQVWSLVAAKQRLLLLHVDINHHCVLVCLSIHFLYLSLLLLGFSQVLKWDVIFFVIALATLVGIASYNFFTNDWMTFLLLTLHG